MPLNYKSDLTLLIEYWEREKKSVEKLIKDLLDQHEYLYAEYQSKALWEINRNLTLFHRFQDPLYEEKARFENLKKLGSKRKKVLKEFYLDITATQERRLRQLDTQTKSFFCDSQQVDDALFNLLEGKIKLFTLGFLKKQIDAESQDDYNLKLDFKLEDGDILKISTPIGNNLKHVFSHFDLNEDETQRVNPFKGLGFELNEAEATLIYWYDIKNLKNAGTIKVLLARLMYEFYWYYESENAEIRFVYNNSIDKHN
jgi:hypothetical protein